MEIDFLGLNSHKHKLEQENLTTPFTDTGGGVEISLSLSTASSLNFSDLQKRKWEFADRDNKALSPSCSGSTKQPGLLLVAPPVFRRSAAGGFPYDLNDAAIPNLRNMSPLSAENSIYVAAGNASTSILPVTGHIPTVAMARRATLARFLEKRLHRMNQARAAQVMGKPPSGTEVCDTGITKNNSKKIKCMSLMRR